MDYEDPDLKAYLDHAEREMLPKMENARMSIAIMTGKVDIKLCLEVGAAVLYDKPIIIVAWPGAAIPANVKRVAACIIQGDITDPAIQDEVQAAVNSVLAHDSRAKV